jgi:lysyl endopeptidase
MRRRETMKRILVAISFFASVAVGSVLMVHAIECPPEPSLTLPRVKAMVVSPGIHRKVARAPGETVFLPPLDIVKGSAAKSKEIGAPLMVGEHRPISADSKLKWRVISNDDGQTVVRLVIQSPEAVMIRPHFESFPAYDTAKVYVYGDDPETAEGPITKPAFIKGSDFWGPPIRTENYYIEAVLPADGKYKPNLPVIDKISHVYEDVFASSKEDDTACIPDFSCYPDYADLGAGVAAIFIEKPEGTGHCTGSLINDRDPKVQIPWFLTANHCGIDKTVAQHSYFYFHFQTPGCNETPPDYHNTTARVDGAQHIFSYTLSDITLLRLNGEVPAGAMLLGWTSAAIGTGEDTIGIHHPRGTFKRISFGHTSTEIHAPYD